MAIIQELTSDRNNSYNLDAGYWMLDTGYWILDAAIQAVIAKERLKIFRVTNLLRD